MSLKEFNMQFLSSNTLLSRFNKPKSEIKVLIISQVRLWLITVMHLVQDWNERSCQRRELEQLSIYQLKDIGISKEDAIHEASKPFWKK